MTEIKHKLWNHIVSASGTHGAGIKGEQEALKTYVDDRVGTQVSWRRMQRTGTSYWQQKR